MSDELLLISTGLLLVGLVVALLVFRKRPMTPVEPLSSSEGEDREFWNNVVKNMMDLFVNPELQLRKSQGRLPGNFRLRAVQVIFNVDDTDARVRLNSEVRAVAQINTSRDVKAGDVITEVDVQKVESLELLPEDGNAGHFTMLWIGDNIHISFDFQRNRARIQKHLAAARQFLDTATNALERENYNAFSDNLFSAVELMAKSILLEIPDGEYVRSKKHEFFRTRFNKLVHTGIFDSRFGELYNAAWKNRETARYLSGELTMTSEDGKKLLDVAEDMYQRARGAAGCQ